MTSFSPGWNLNAITWSFFWISARAEISSPVCETGWKYQPGLKVPPCNRKRLFTICSGSWGEISARLTGELNKALTVFFVLISNLWNQNCQFLVHPFLISVSEIRKSEIKDQGIYEPDESVWCRAILFEKKKTSFNLRLISLFGMCPCYPGEQSIPEHFGCPATVRIRFSNIIYIFLYF